MLLNQLPSPLTFLMATKRPKRSLLNLKRRMRRKKLLIKMRWTRNIMISIRRIRKRDTKRNPRSSIKRKNPKRRQKLKRLV